MAISRTSSTSGPSLEALFAEISKLAAEEAKKTPRWKRIAKVGLIAGSGSLAGYGAGVLLEHAAKKTLGPRYQQWAPASRMKVILPLLGLSMAGLHASREYATQARQREYERE